MFKVGSGAPGNWLDTFAMLTECTDAKFCNTTAQVTKDKKCYKKKTYFYIKKHTTAQISKAKKLIKKKTIFPGSQDWQLEQHLRQFQSEPDFNSEPF